MSFQPVIIGTGLSAWSFLKATSATQRAAHEADPVARREEDYFRGTIGSIDTAEQLVADRRLLSIALGAFGLSADLPNKFFVQTVLDDGTLDPSALSNRLADSRYTEFARTFGFGDFGTPRTKLSGFADEILFKARTQRFEEAVGIQDDTLRQALYFERRLPELSEAGGSDDTLWFRIMGDRALRSVMEKSLGLPHSFGQLDIDKQLEIFRDKSQARFGTSAIEDLAQPERLEEVVRVFLLREQVNTGGAASSASIALTLLQR